MLPYVLVNSTQVADNFAALVNTDSVPLLHSIDVDESGAVIDAGVWTGTNSLGQILGGFGHHCNDWTTNSAANYSTESAITGGSSKTDFEWTDSGLPDCSRQEHLYCFEQ